MKATCAAKSKLFGDLICKPEIICLKTLFLLIGIGILSACSDSSDNPGHGNDKLEGVWQQHACEMAIPDGLRVDDFTCGSFFVPVDWDNPDDDTVAFEVAILAARSNPSKPDPFIFLGGGPGAWNLEGYLYREAGTVLSPIAETRDIIFFDKRGNGLSNPSLFCPEFYEQSTQLYSVVADSSQDVDTLLIGYEKCRTRLAGEGIRLSHFNTYQIANDLASLMRVLGYESYNLFGISAGTREAQTMMRDHPEGVRSVILDSTAYPADGSPANWAPNFLRSLERLFASCAASSTCASTYPDLKETLIRAVNQLNETPHYSPVTRDDGSTLDIYVTGDRFAAGMQSALYRVDLMSLLPLVIYNTAAGNMSLLDAFVPQLVSTGGDDLGLRASTRCAETIPFSSLEEAIAKKEGLNPVLAEPIFQRASRLQYDMCEIWQVTPRPDIERHPISSDVPTLILAGEYDPATPSSNGELVAETLSKSQYFLFNGLSHGVLRAPSSEPGKISCAMKMTLEFLDDPYSLVDGACASTLPGPFD